MKECVVIRAFKDKYDDEVSYVRGQRIVVSEERMNEMNFKKIRVIEVLRDEYTAIIVPTIEEETETPVEEETETPVEEETENIKVTKRSSRKKESAE